MKTFYPQVVIEFEVEDPDRHLPCAAKSSAVRVLDLPGELTMPTLIAKPTRIEAAGNKPKLIDEYIGRVNSGPRPGERCSDAKSGWLD